MARRRGRRAGPDVIRAYLDRVCVVMMSAVGDAVHVLPVVNALRRHYAETHLTWILQPGPASLVRGHPAVDEIVERPPGVGGLLAVRRALALRRFDLVLDLQVALKAGIVTGLLRAPVKLGFDRARARDLNWLFTTHQIPPHPPQHVQDQYLEFLDALGVAHDVVEWRLGPRLDERDWQRGFVAPIERPIAALAVATSNPQKDWPPERWAALADVLYADFGLQPVLVGGRSVREREAEARIRRLASAPVVSALGSGLRRLVAILDASALVVSPDSAPMHIAVALDRPVVGLMGYTNPKRTGPYRRFHDLLVDAYGDPGEDYPVTIAYRRGRMARIDVGDVLARVERWRERYARGVG